MKDLVNEKHIIDSLNIGDIKKVIISNMDEHILNKIKTKL